MPDQQYRPEIDGLRAVAVLSVILFHMKIAGFAGGFVGVDVFFVISGYLISRNILSMSDSGSFRFGEFYLRRARRLFPALFVTASITFALGVIILPPLWLRSLAKEVTWSVLSISNIQYWRESHQYFSSSADTLGLLHVWSLSVEEQFYLVWPALIIISVRYLGRSSLPWVLIGLGLASLLSAQWRHVSDPTAAFFLPQFRVFEFCLGAAMVLIERSHRPTMAISAALSLAGMAAIATSIVYFSDATPSAPLLLLLPCLGAACVIQAGQTSPYASLLTNRSIAALGQISYSLYLGHWPVLFFYRAMFARLPTGTGEVVSTMAVMLLVALAMFWFIERPYRQRSRENRKFVFAAVSAATALALAAHVAFLQQGWEWRIPPQQQAANDRQQFGMTPCVPVSGKRCAFGTINAPLAVEFFGDSFVHQYVAAFQPLLEQMSIRGETSTVSGCMLLLGLRTPNDPRERICDDERRDEITRVATSNSLIVIGQAWSGYNPLASDDGSPPTLNQDESNARIALALERTISALGGKRRQFLIIGEQVSVSCEINNLLLQRSALLRSTKPRCAAPTIEDVRLRTRSINSMLESVRRRHPENVRLLFPEDYLCDRTCAVMDGDLSLYWDDGHFTVAGAGFVGKKADRILREFLSLPAS